MGTKNKQRRHAKAKRRAEQARRRPSWASSGSSHSDDWRSGGRRSADDTARRVREALWTLGGVRQSADPRAAMLELETADFGVVASEAETLLQLLVGTLWTNGWQPAELARHGRRHDPRVGRVVALAIAADHGQRDRRTLHPHWVVQADEIAG